MAGWWVAERSHAVPDLPSPLQTWEESKLYILEPLAKRGEMDQGIVLLAFVQPDSRRARVPARASPSRRRSDSCWASRDADTHVRSDHAGAAADLAAGLAAARADPVSEVGAGGTLCHRGLLDVADGASTRWRACARFHRTTGTWPRCCACRGSTTFTKIVVPATLPYMFTGYRLSLGIAWLVIVASEMLTGTPGVGGFLWQEYNSLDLRAHPAGDPDHRRRRVRRSTA